MRETEAECRGGRGGGRARQDVQERPGRRGGNPAGGDGRNGTRTGRASAGRRDRLAPQRGRRARSSAPARVRLRVRARRPRLCRRLCFRRGGTTRLLSLCGRLVRRLTLSLGCPPPGQGDPRAGGTTPCRGRVWTTRGRGDADRCGAVLGGRREGPRVCGGAENAGCGLWTSPGREAEGETDGGAEEGGGRCSRHLT